MTITTQTMKDRQDVKHVLKAYARVCKLRQVAKNARDEAQEDTIEWVVSELRFNAIECRRIALRQRVLAFADDHPDPLPPDAALDLAILLPVDAELEALNELRSAIVGDA